MLKIQDKKILITGVCGTIGSELLCLLSDSNRFPNCEIIGIDNNESQIFFQELEYKNNPAVKLALADIRDRDACKRHMRGVDIVLHAAALKHVIICEKSPMEAIQTNINALNNLIMVAQEIGVQRFIFTSSDKAVNPTNVMGTSKLMGERLVTAANYDQPDQRTIFASTRFGNVLGSSGSVVQIFKQQILQAGPVTLTDKEMTRFIMTKREAAELVIESCICAQGGEVFVTKMPVVKIIDLAKTMIEELCKHDPELKHGIDLIEIGSKPGEKMYEELMSEEETNRAIELAKFFAILPAVKVLDDDKNYEHHDIVSNVVKNAYNSKFEREICQTKISKLLHEAKLI